MDASCSVDWQHAPTSSSKRSARDTSSALGLGHESLASTNPGLIVCSLTPFGQTGPWRDYMTSDLLHMAAGGEMASCGYDEADVPGAPPIAPGGGNAWHMGGHFAYMAIMAALVYRTVSGAGTVHRCLDPRGLRPHHRIRDRQLHLPRRSGATPHRPSPRHRPTPRTQFRAKDGRYVNALVSGRLNPRYVKDLAALLDGYGMAGDLKDAKYQDLR